MASLSSKVKQYCANNGVASVDFMTDVLLQDDSNGQGPYIKEWNISSVAKPTDEQLNAVDSAADLEERQNAVRNEEGFTGNPASTDTFFGIVLGNTFDIGKPTDATVGAASLSTDFFVKNAQTLTTLSMAGSTNGAMVGPVTISGTITIPSGSTFVIL
jgi:hypothetical protein